MATIATRYFEGPTVADSHDVESHLSRLVGEAFHGRPSMIAEAGEPAVKLVRVKYSGESRESGESESNKVSSRRGFLRAKSGIPCDSKTPFRGEIEEMLWDKQ